MGRSWAEVLQQIRQQSVDLLLICLGESKLHPNVLTAFNELSQQSPLLPVLVINQQLSQSSDELESLEPVLAVIANQILPPSLSMEELLNHIHQTLVRSN